MNVGVEEVILVFDNQPVADSLLSEDICTFLQLQKLLGVGVATDWVEISYRCYEIYCPCFGLVFLGYYEKSLSLSAM